MEKQNQKNDKILASVIPLSILMILVLTTVLIGLFNFAFNKVEEYAIGENLRFCVNNIQTELERIDGVVFEWSAWDDTALFVEGKNPDYDKNNMVDSTIQQQNLNMLCVVDLQGVPLVNRCVKFHENKLQSVDLSFLSSKNLRKNKGLWEHKDADSHIAGYYATEGGVLMLCSRPVTNNNNTDPVRGAVIMGRFISDRFIESMTRQSCLDFQWWNLQSDYTRGALTKYLSRISAENPIHIEYKIDTITAYTVLPDINGNDAVLIKFVVANNVSLYKENLMFKGIGIFLLVGIVFILYQASFINKNCGICRGRMSDDPQTNLDSQYISFEQTAKSQKPVKDTISI